MKFIYYKMKNNKNLLSFNFWQIIIIYIITIIFAFYTNIIIGVIVSVFSIFSYLYIIFAANKIKDMNNERNT